MKHIFVIAALGFFLAACMNSSKESKGVSEMQKKAMEDTAHYTTIEWLDSTVKNIGKVKLGQEVEIAFHFRNTGKSNLIIANVSASCGCTTPDKPEKPIAPGEEGVIKGVFNSKGQHVGEVRKDIYVIANTMPSQTHSLVFNVEITN